MVKCYFLFHLGFVLRKHYFKAQILFTDIYSNLYSIELKLKIEIIFLLKKNSSLSAQSLSPDNNLCLFIDGTILYISYIAKSRLAKIRKLTSTSQKSYIK